MCVRAWLECPVVFSALALISFSIFVSGPHFLYSLQLPDGLQIAALRLWQSKMVKPWHPERKHRKFAIVAGCPLPKGNQHDELHALRMRLMLACRLPQTGGPLAHSCNELASSSATISASAVCKITLLRQRRHPTTRTLIRLRVCLIRIHCFRHFYARHFVLCFHVLCNVRLAYICNEV